MEFPYRAFLCACGGRYAPPPHAWGILPYLASRYVRGRFIPTCVGNTDETRDYEQQENGSSPRAWGIRTPLPASPAADRFIPTCVGNTLGNGIPAATPSVHPHVRGEYKNHLHRRRTDGGSSPRAWGIPRQALSPQGARRFIPTCVGNTPAMCAVGTACTVHPHVRGEYSSRKHEEFLKVIIAAKIYRSGTA